MEPMGCEGLACCLKHLFFALSAGHPAALVGFRS